MVDHGALSTYLISVFVILEPIFIANQAVLGQLGVPGIYASFIVGLVILVYNFVNPRNADPVDAA